MSEDIFHLQALTDDSPGTLDESTSEAPIGNREEGWLKIGQILKSQLSQSNDAFSKYLLGLVSKFEITPEELAKVVVRSRKGGGNGQLTVTDTEGNYHREIIYESLLELIRYSEYRYEGPTFQAIRSKNRSGRPESISQSFTSRSRKLGYQRKRWDRGIERSKKARRFFQSLEEQ